MSKQLWFATLIESQLRIHDRIISKATYPISCKDSIKLIEFAQFFSELAFRLVYNEY